MSEFHIPSQNTLAKAKPRYVFRVSSPPQSRSKAVVCVSTPRMYPHSGYFLVYIYFFVNCRYVHSEARLLLNDMLLFWYCLRSWRVLLILDFLILDNFFQLCKLFLTAAMHRISNSSNEFLHFFQMLQ